MRRARKRGPGPSHLLITPDCAGNVVGIDPHKRTVTATVADPRGGILASEHFRVSGDGHRALEAWALAVRSDRALGSRGRLELGAPHRDVLVRPRL